MTLNKQKEQFSAAYARAVASVVGLNVSKCEVDDDSIDITFERTGGLAERVDIQLKCTAQPVPDEGNLKFPLKIKNYEDLSRQTIMPRILVVLFVPEKCEHWMEISQERAILKHAAWWLSLENAPATDNDVQVTLTIPRTNLFTPSVLIDFLDKTRNKFTPA
jgi:Domain of unknown function (DUF4365)